MSSDQHLRELEEKYEDYKVYDRNGEKIGKVDDLFIDEADREEYIGVKMGFFGLKSTLIPMEIVRVNEADRRIEVSETRERVKDAPTFSDDDEIDASFEESIRRHFNLDSGGSPGERGSYGAYAGGAASSGTATERSRDTEDTPREGSASAGTAAFRSDQETSRDTGGGTSETTGEQAEEGGRSKVRRRIIREEIIEEDPRDTPR